MLTIAMVFNVVHQIVPALYPQAHVGLYFSAMTSLVVVTGRLGAELTRVTLVPESLIAGVRPSTLFSPVVQ